MDIYLINLDRRPDRLQHMTNRLAVLGLPFHRVEAIDGLGDKDIGFPADHARLTKPEFACYLSHLACWKRLIESGEPRCLVLEDDVHLSKSLPDILSEDTLFTHDFGVTNLETVGSRYYLSPTPIVQSRSFNLKRSVTFKGGSGAYVISRDQAIKLMTRHATPEIPLDDLLYNIDRDWLGRPIIAQLSPAVAIQDIYYYDPASKARDSDMIEIREAYRETRLSRQTRRAKLRADGARLWYRLVKRIGFRRELVEFLP